MMLGCASREWCLSEQERGRSLCVGAQHSFSPRCLLLVASNDDALRSRRKVKMASCRAKAHRRHCHHLAYLRTEVECSTLGQHLKAARV